MYYVYLVVILTRHVCCPLSLANSTIIRVIFLSTLFLITDLLHLFGGGVFALFCSMMSQKQAGIKFQILMQNVL